jgi:putative MATE family efflux protein
MWYFTIPITIQLLITSGLSMIDSIMVGSLGVDAIAGVGIANKFIQFLIVFLQGFASGATIFSAQYWGRKDLHGVRKTLALVSKITVVFTLIATIITMIFTKEILAIFAQDSKVIELAIPFLRIQAIGFLFTGLTMMFSVSLKTIGIVRWPTVFSVITLGTNTLLNWGLIYGNMGLPRLEVSGAAIATVLARVIQTALLAFLLFRHKIIHKPTVDNIPKEEVPLWKNYLSITAPSIANHLTWTLGDLTFFWLFTRVGTNATAAVSLIDPLVFLFICVFTGISDASSVMIGHELGAKNKNTAYNYAMRFVKLTIGLSIASALLIRFVSPQILKLYHITPDVHQLVLQLLTVYACVILFNNLNYINNVGILRVGGDTKFVMWTDTLAVWILAIPLTAIAVYLHWPFVFIYLCSTSHAILRAFIGVYRTYSKKWLRTIV